MKIPKGKYQQSSDGKAKRPKTRVDFDTDIKRSKKDQKSKSLVYPIVTAVAILILCFAIIPSLIKDDKVKKVSNDSNVSSSSKTTSSASEKSTQNNNSKKAPKPEKPIVKAPPKQKEINLLEDNGRKHFFFQNESLISFENGHMLIKGQGRDLRPMKKILITKESYTNYKLIFEFQWIDEQSDTGLDVHFDGEKFYEVNVSNFTKTATIHSKRAGKFNVDGQPFVIFRPNKRYCIRQDFWHRIETTCKDNTLNVVINGKQVVHVENMRHSGGKIKMTLYKNLGIEIRKFDVIPLD